jgi:flavin reductase (DIM6/NTAB) family NADH-FMN oxidoreductase RutF
MTKTQIGAKTYMYPMPIVLVGANVNGKPNYLTIAYCGIAQHVPPMVSVTMGKHHYTNAGIRENGTFSVNIPSEDMVEVTDYVGIHSGRTIDKSTLFDNFYGILETAPMIRECPLNLECRLVQTVDFEGSNELFIGEIVEVYADEQCLTEDLPDIRKIRPMVFSMHDNNYWKIGEHIGRAWKLGKDYKPK